MTSSSKPRGDGVLHGDDTERGHEAKLPSHPPNVINELLPNAIGVDSSVPRHHGEEGWFVLKRGALNHAYP
jgi:hypothetical protein